MRLNGAGGGGCGAAGRARRRRGRGVAASPTVPPAGAEVVPAGTADRGDALGGVSAVTVPTAGAVRESTTHPSRVGERVQPGARPLVRSIQQPGYLKPVVEKSRVGERVPLVRSRAPLVATEPRVSSSRRPGCPRPRPFGEHVTEGYVGRAQGDPAMPNGQLQLVGCGRPRSRERKLSLLTHSLWHHMVVSGLGRPISPWRKSPLHSSGDASRLTALLLGQICPIFSLVAPCQAGASPLSVRRGVSPRAAIVGFDSPNVGRMSSTVYAVTSAQPSGRDEIEICTTLTTCMKFCRFRQQPIRT